MGGHIHKQQRLSNRVAFLFYKKLGVFILKTDIDSIINLLQQEMKFYETTNNPAWTPDKNIGFKEGLKYSHDLLVRLKPSFDSMN